MSLQNPENAKSLLGVLALSSGFLLAFGFTQYSLGVNTRLKGKFRVVHWAYFFAVPIIQDLGPLSPGSPGNPKLQLLAAQPAETDVSSKLMLLVKAPYLEFAFSNPKQL